MDPLPLEIRRLLVHNHKRLIIPKIKIDKFEQKISKKEEFLRNAKINNLHYTKIEL